MMKIFFALITIIALANCSHMKEGAEESQGSEELSVDTGKKSSKESPKEEAALPPISKKALSELSKAFESKNQKELFNVAGQVLSQNPHDAQALNALALHHIQRGEWGAARLLIERALEKNKNIAGLYNNLGVIDLREDSLESAYLNFKTAYSIDSRNSNVLNNLGSIYIKYLDYGKAERPIEDAYSFMPESLSVTNNYAILKRSLGQYDESARLYKKVLDKDPRNVSTILNYAILLIEYMKKYDEGERLLNKLEFLESNEPYVRAKMTELNNKLQAARK
jgi:Tfp pilus assembly protein PilF